MIKILLCGPKSFFARNFIENCYSKNYRIYLLTRNLKEFNEIKKKYKKYEFDNILFKDVFKFRKLIKFNIIINCFVKYENGQNSLDEIFYANVNLPINIYKYAITTKSDLFINLDTILDKNYNFYSFSKNVFRNLIKFNSNITAIKTINIKFHNFYSLDINDSNFISKIIKVSKNNKKIDLTKGIQKREFLHIYDANHLVKKFIDNNRKFQNNRFYEFNIGCPPNLEIKFIANKLRLIFKSNKKLNYFSLSYKNKFQKENYCSQNKKVDNYFFWQPKKKLTDLLKQKTIKY